MTATMPHQPARGPRRPRVGYLTFCSAETSIRAKNGKAQVSVVATRASVPSARLVMVDGRQFAASCLVPDGLVRIALKKPFSDGTIAVDLDPFSLLCRLVALVPAPRFHTVPYFGVLAAAANRRPLVVPKATAEPSH